MKTDITERQTKTRTDAEPKGSRIVKPKMFSVPGSDRDPVRAFRFYASKRPEQTNSEDSPFYLAVSLTKMANSSKPWFNVPPMGVNKLNSLTKTIAQKAGLHAENLTSHSRRKRMIQVYQPRSSPYSHRASLWPYKCLEPQQLQFTFRETAAEYLQHLEQYHFN